MSKTSNGMNISYSKLLFWQNRKSAGGSLPPLADPSRDWNLILMGGACLLLGFIAFAGVLYWQSAEAPTFTLAPSQNQLLSPQKLTALLSQYDALAREHAALLKTPPAFADPAIAQ